MALTKRAIDAQRFDPAGPPAQILWDGGLKGFGCRVFETGAKSFILDYRVGGRKRRYTIGRYGAFTPDQARKKARELLVAIEGGADPVAERKQTREAATVKDFAATYLERHAKARKKSWPEDERRLNKYVVPALGSRTLISVTRADVARLHGKIGRKAKVEANRVLALISIMYTQANEWGYTPQGFANPAHGVKPFTEKSRDRWVKPAELPRLMEAIRADESAHVRGFFLLALMLGTRRSELLHARWSDVDLDRREITLRNTKAGNDHVLPLPARAVAVLESLPRFLGNPHIFPSPVGPGKPLRDVKRQWKRIRSESGLLDVRLHDLRRTVGSWLATSGASLHLIGSVLNHADADTTRIYARLAEDAARGALEDHAERLYTVGGGA